MNLRFFKVLLLTLSVSPAFSQVEIGGDTSQVNYKVPVEYEIADITVSGGPNLDAAVLRMLSGLARGERVFIPGEKIAKAINNLWKQGLFADVGIYATRFVGDKVYLEIRVVERPRLSGFLIHNTKKADQEELRDKYNIVRGQVVTENMKQSISHITRTYFVAKGYLNTEVSVAESPDSMQANGVYLHITVDKREKVKVSEIEFNGNQALSDGKLRRAMKETKRKRWYAFFRSAKFIEDEYETDKENIVAKYNEKGYRDAEIPRDSVTQINPKRVEISIDLEEGRQYYFRNIYWTGNTRYSDAELDQILGIKSGDVYNQSVLETRLFMNPNGRDVSSLYMDEGYLFFSITPVEVLVERDSIDIEMRIYEGKQARVNRIIISGNTKTHDHVILREIRTKPGDLFSRTDIIRTQRELAQLGYFDPEKLAVNPRPNPADGTVDIEYVVEERPSDQLELSGGWGQNRIVGTLGVSFNNFSARNMFKKDSWRPLPSGDGQRLSLRVQSTGLYYTSGSFSFTEPWLGGKKPNAFTISTYYTVSTNGEKRYLEKEPEKIENPARQSIGITGASVGLGQRLKWPDDFFTLHQEVGFLQYSLKNYQSFIFTDGISNNLSYKVILSRSSVDQPIYPRTGSQTSITVQATPPYSLFNDKDYSQLELNERFKWNEYHKWKFTTTWYTKLAGNLVMSTRAGFGFLGLYDKNMGITPFERFSLGGSGLTGAGGTAFFLGKEIIALRGYDDNSVSASVGSSIISKYTLELRYPISLNPNATVYVLGFTEAGNTWQNFKQFNPFDVKRSAGIGARVYLPMFGLLGLDYGWPFDDLPGRTVDKKGQLHFTIGFNLGEL